MKIYVYYETIIKNLLDEVKSLKEEKRIIKIKKK